MLLASRDAGLLFKLQRALFFFVNQRLKVVSGNFANLEEFAALPLESAVKVRDAFLQHTNLVHTFADENPAQLTEDELNIVLSWRHHVAGKFYIFRELKKHTIFLSSDNHTVAYGVHALTRPFEELVGPAMPLMVQAVLLPFKDMIVYDGFMTRYNIFYGPGIRRSLNDSFKEAKARHGIITSLPFSENTESQKTTRAPKATPTAGPRPQAKQEIAEVLRDVIKMIDQFCRDHLNDEYVVLCRKLAAKLARKRPSPLFRGSPNSWASGIVRTIGWVNFLHDRSQSPSMRLSDIDAGFGISESSGAAKLKAIRTMLKIHQFGHEWVLPSRLDDNPLIWMIQVDGFMVDARDAPREVQEIAFKKGLIPYIPADRQQV